MQHELMLWAAEHYRIRGGRESTGMGGTSPGGVVSLYLELSHAGVLGRLGLMSPSVWWNRNSILRFVDRRAAWGVERARVRLDVGDREGERTVHDVELPARCLAGNGWRAGESMHFEQVGGGTRDEAS
jgi:predicted alpha/beta superfamily hydrolase